MKIIHTADLHLGQIIYQNYDRVDEHEHFFTQLEAMCQEDQPDALVVSGDLFDIQQPSAATKKSFTGHFVRLHDSCPQMRIVIIAGNHDSASRLQADSAVWKYANTFIAGTPPPADCLTSPDGWQEDFIVKLECGYIVALPYMPGERTKVIQSILDKVAEDNRDGKPVIMTGHLSVAGTDTGSQDTEIGRIVTQSISSLGSGYDYLALGHIHKPQTVGHQDDCMKDNVTYPSGAVRYSGSALHVSCDEKYPHTVSVVQIQSHGADVHIRQRRIDQLRHFYELPLDGSSFKSAEDAIVAVKEFALKNVSGYIRLRISYDAAIPSDFNNSIYDVLGTYGDRIRFNPKHIWTGTPQREDDHLSRPAFEVAELQQMTDPMTFIEKTADMYPKLDIEEVRKAFEEIKEEVLRIREESDTPKAGKKKAKLSLTDEGETEEN